METVEQSSEKSDSYLAEEKESFMNKRLRLSVNVTMILGFFAVLSIILHYLALADIGHGGEDLSLEWHIAGISLLILAVFIISTFITLGLLLKSSALWK